MSIRDLPDRLLAPHVLALIRDGQVASFQELGARLGMAIPAPSISDALEIDRLETILRNFESIGLIRIIPDGDTLALAPTDLIARVQQALHLSLSDLAKPPQAAVLIPPFVDPRVIAELRQINHRNFDLTKVIRFCEELNASYQARNFLASILLIRALLNHIPPIFGHSSFLQVVNSSRKSLKELLKPLEEIARDVADLHTHCLIRHKESLPTQNQVEPFRANFEVLLLEIIAQLSPMHSNASP